ESSLTTSLLVRRALADRAGERNTLRSMGLLHWHQGRNREALEFAEQSLRIARAHGDHAAIVGDLTSCGAILRALGRHAEARCALEEALSTGGSTDTGGAAESQSEVAVMHVYALQNLANSYRAGGELEEALQCLQRA